MYIYLLFYLWFIYYLFILFKKKLLTFPIHVLILLELIFVYGHIYIDF